MPVGDIWCLISQIKGEADQCRTERCAVLQDPGPSEQAVAAKSPLAGSQAAEDAADFINAVEKLHHHYNVPALPGMWS